MTRPFEYLDNTIGVEINFNKIFYKPEKLEPIQDLLADLAQLENELKTLEADYRYETSPVLRDEFHVTF